VEAEHCIAIKRTSKGKAAFHERKKRMRENRGHPKIKRAESGSRGRGEERNINLLPLGGGRDGNSCRKNRSGLYGK